MTAFREILAAALASYEAGRMSIEGFTDMVRAAIALADSSTPTATANPAPSRAAAPSLADVRRAVGVEPTESKLPRHAVNAPIDIDHPDAAMEEVMGAALTDYRKGTMDADTARQVAERRAGLIREARRAGQRESSLCAICGTKADTRVAGTDYCAQHADEAPRPARPTVMP